MKALVVYESMYGNTHEIANAIAEGLGSLGEVVVTSVADTASTVEAELLVVGGPTHVHGLSRSSSRKAAAETASKDDAIDIEPDATGPGLREWFKQLPKVAGVYGAAFDTRLDKSQVLTGSAAKGVAKRLRRLGYESFIDPESFFVEDGDGPLEAGELERAKQWGRELADRLQPALH